LPLSARAFICVGVATFGVAAIRSTLLLAGHRAVRALRWTDEGEWIVCLGRRRICHRARLARGSFQLGRLGLFLWFETCDGMHGIFIDAGMQAPGSYRRLVRRLKQPPAS